MIHRIVAGLFARRLSCVHAKGLGDGLGFRGVSGQPDDAGIEVLKIGLQNIRRVALGIDGDEKRGDFFVRPQLLENRRNIEQRRWTKSALQLRDDVYGYSRRVKAALGLQG
jgi:hypothetical protein